MSDGLDFDSSVPTHVRTIEIASYDRPDHFVMVAKMRDDRPWAETEDPEYAHLHDISLTVKVGIESLEIMEARATMARFPHVECRLIEGAFEDLVGLSLKPGYSRAVQERFGRTLGCTHLEMLAKALAPAVFQVVPSSKRRRLGPSPAEGLITTKHAAAITGSCHVWREGGPAPTKLTLGWKPGLAPVPVPTVEEFERVGAERINHSKRHDDEG